MSGTGENKIGMNRLFCIAMFAFCAGFLSAQDVSWPEIGLDAKPAARWWWMGSAVDKENLTRNLEAYAAAGMGTMEITPIYGVQGNDAKDIPFLSDGCRCCNIRKVKRPVWACRLI
jgi:hypothetical protein